MFKIYLFFLASIYSFSVNAFSTLDDDFSFSLKRTHTNVSSHLSPELETLPVELLLHLFSYLKKDDWIALENTSKHCSTVVGNLWKQKGYSLANEWEVRPSLNIPFTPPQWKEMSLILSLAKRSHKRLKQHPESLTVDDLNSLEKAIDKGSLKACKTYLYHWLHSNNLRESEIYDEKVSLYARTVAQILKEVWVAKEHSLIGPEEKDEAHYKYLKALYNQATANIDNMLEDSIIERLIPLKKRGHAKAFYLSYLLTGNIAELYNAAHHGYKVAQYELGRALEIGFFGDANISKAFRYYEQTANNGYAKAQYRLGSLYAEGIGISQDKVKALFWHQKAAHQGYALAQNNLGILYEEGLWINQNLGEAAYWYRKAANKGCNIALENLSAVAKRAQN